MKLAQRFHATMYALPPLWRRCMILLYSIMLVMGVVWIITVITSDHLGNHCSISWYVEYLKTSAMFADASGQSMFGDSVRTAMFVVSNCIGRLLADLIAVFPILLAPVTLPTIAIFYGVTIIMERLRLSPLVQIVLNVCLIPMIFWVLSSVYWIIIFGLFDAS
jgi:hypothetical protein